MALVRAMPAMAWTLFKLLRKEKSVRDRDRTDLSSRWFCDHSTALEAPPNPKGIVLSETLACDSQWLV